jgi:preprotein translocase subunit SecY
MSLLTSITSYLPEVEPPKQKRLSFKEKFKWTGMVLVLFFILGLMPLWGLGGNALSRFEALSIILGAKFGSLISLGIGPIVTASIVLQLLQGAGLLKFDMNSKEGKAGFTSLQKLLAIGFIVFEAIIYVLMGGLSPAAGVSPWVLIAQLCIGGFLIMLFDEVISKWGFGQGVGLFIVAGVSESIVVQMISWLPSVTNPQIPTGAIPALFKFIGLGDPIQAGIAFAGIIATVIVFAMAVYVQAMKIEIPLAFGRVRGHGVRWPLQFIYTSNIPVILIAALLANLQLISGFLTEGSLFSRILSYLGPIDLVELIITDTFTVAAATQGIVYLLFMICGAVMFSIFWVQTAGLDAKSQAEKIMASGLQVPGFRKDKRVLERMLNRYIWPLTIMGAITVGFLAGVADLTGAFGRGTGILLSVMIIYKLYEEIAKQHMMDMNPMMRKFMEK